MGSPVLLGYVVRFLSYSEWVVGGLVLLAGCNRVFLYGILVLSPFDPRQISPKLTWQILCAGGVDALYILINKDIPTVCIFEVVPLFRWGFVRLWEYEPFAIVAHCVCLLGVSILYRYLLISEPVPGWLVYVFQLGFVL